MLPMQIEFPKFVADQLLTSEDLNNLFGYLDEQNRITRTNLIGVGIVCGLQLVVNNLQNSVTITKGCGVTSEGYLISVPTNTYTQYKRYKVDTPQIYDKFYKIADANKVPIEVWELKKAAVEAGLQTIDAGFLKDKVIMLFVELKQIENKNCDPNSCDDKGIKIEVSFLPMAVAAADVALLIGTTAGSFGANTYTALPEVRMKRWNVPNTNPIGSEEIFNSFLNVLNKTFIDQIETTLSTVYALFGSVVAKEYTSNPFAGLSAQFNYLYNGTINQQQLKHLQYYYDFFSDLIQAYDEFRKAGTKISTTCCPDSDLFPRHLLLGKAIETVTTGMLPYRHYFIYSPLADQKKTINELKLLFTRLVLLIRQFHLPSVSGFNKDYDEFIRITPSMLCNVPLSQKAIPYYYVVNSGPTPLYLNWNYQRTLLNDATRNLSYHAKQYNTSNEFVQEPLLYDLEPYNFLRIEGIVGKSYTHVLKQVKQQINKNRLPIDIIALTTEASSKFVKETWGKRVEAKESLEMLCHFQDLESMYDSMRREILCILCKELKFYYDFSIEFMGKMIEKYKQATGTSHVELFDVCSSGYKLKEKSLGLLIELLHRNGLTDETLTIEFLKNSFFGTDLPDNDNDDIPDGINVSQSTMLLTILNFFKVPLGIIRLSTLLTEDLATFDIKAYCDASNLLAEYAKSLKALLDISTNVQRNSLGIAAKNGPSQVSALFAGKSNETTVATESTEIVSTNMLSRLATSNNGLAAILMVIFMIEDLMDHLEVLIYNCKCSALSSLKKDYLRRYQMVSRVRQFGYFSKMHPGLQHKAGVPMGGTFIIVYHTKQQKREVGSKRFEESEVAVIEKSLNINSSKRGEASEKETLKRNAKVGGIVVNENGSPVPGAIVSIVETGEAVTTSINGVFTLVSNAVPYTLEVNQHGYKTFEQVQSDEGSNLKIELALEEEDDFGEILNGMVIADFYLPYRCCSDCPPIQYVVNDPATPATVANIGPNANAGPNQTIVLPTEKATLNGSASADEDGVITFYKWVKLSGPV